MLQQVSLAAARSLRAQISQQPAVVISAVRGYASGVTDDKFTVEVTPYLAHKITPPDNKVETSTKELMDMFTWMFRMRRMEIAGDLAYKAKLIRGFCHLYDGQEAVLTGMEFALTKSDSLITSYRDHCQMLTRGGTVYEVMAELFGRAEGATKGIGGSMHMYSRKNNFYGGNGIVGAQIPLGAGIALAHKYKGEKNVCVTMYGDGAANQGQKYEALNMAGLWNIPAIFVCENNHYGMGTAVWRSAKNPTFYTRGDYIPGLRVDGMDALAVKHATKFAKEYALENGPIILEMDTYRYHGHSMSDPGSSYRTRDEINTTRNERDPIERAKKALLAHGVDQTAIKKVEREVKAEVDAAVEQAKAGTFPPTSWLWKNVYVDNANMSMRQVDGTYVTPNFDPEYKHA